MTFLATSLAGNYQAASAIVAGLVGGLAFLAVVYMGLGVGMTRMDLLSLLGSMMTSRASGAATYAVGFLVHMTLSAVFGLVHAGILTAIGVTSVGQTALWDLVVGAIHGGLILVILPVMLTVAHPLVRGGQLAQPGVALVGYGSMTPAGSLLAHGAFGLVMGALYAAAVL